MTFCGSTKLESEKMSWCGADWPGPRSAASERPDTSLVDSVSMVVNEMPVTVSVEAVLITFNAAIACQSIIAVSSRPKLIT